MNEPAKEQELCRLCGDRPPYADGMEICAQCMGFEKEETLSHAVTNYDPTAEEAAIQAERRKAERPCSGCGRTPSQTKFYPSRQDKCVECIKARQADRAAQTPKTYTDLDPVVSAEIDAHPDSWLLKPSVAPEGTPSSAATCTCRECGASFEPYLNGVATVVNYCRPCMKKRLKRGVNKADVVPSFQIIIDLEQDKEIFEALTVDAKRSRRSLENQAIFLLEKTLLTKGA